MATVADKDTELKRVWSLIEQVNDPEIPVLSVIDLGIVRDVTLISDKELELSITPTYSGCPAMQLIEWELRTQLVRHGYERVHIQTVLSPAWTTDWMTEAGRRKLEAYGIAPPGPVPSVCDTGLFAREDAVPCPRCRSYNTTLISRFGSTPCKAHYKCNDCLEPFDHFKCH